MNENEPFRPSENGSGDGDRDERGRFKPGWKGGPGAPSAKYARQLSATLSEVLFTVASRDRLVSVIDAMLKRAEAGDVAAARLIVERLGGPCIDATIGERIAQLEHLAEQKEADNV